MLAAGQFQPGFVQTLEIPGIILFRIPGPGKSWKKAGPGKSWNFEPAVLEFLVLV